MLLLMVFKVHKTVASAPIQSLFADGVVFGGFEIHVGILTIIQTKARDITPIVVIILAA